MRQAALVWLPFVLLGGCQFIPGTDWHKIRQAKEAVAAVLIDPSSAQFRNVEIGHEGAVCGEVNGKNRMGAYVGFTRFVAMADIPPTLDPQVTVTQEDFEREMADARRALRNPYSASLARFNLERANEINEQVFAQSLFDIDWESQCVPPGPASAGGNREVPPVPVGAEPPVAKQDAPAPTARATPRRASPPPGTPDRVEAHEVTEQDVAAINERLRAFEAPGVAPGPTAPGTTAAPVGNGGMEPTT